MVPLYFPFIFICCLICQIEHGNIFTNLQIMTPGQPWLEQHTCLLLKVVHPSGLAALRVNIVCWCGILTQTCEWRIMIALLCHR